MQKFEEGGGFMKKIFTLALVGILCVYSLGFAFDIVIFGDNRPHNQGEPQRPVFKQILKETNYWRPDFCINVGDIVQGYTRDDALFEWEYRDYIGTIANLKVPIYHVAGNHEICWGAGRRLYSKYIGQTYYYIDHKGFRFIFLFTDDANKCNYVSIEQYKWLVDTLNEAQKKSLTPVVFMHRPIFTPLRGEKKGYGASGGIEGSSWGIGWKDKAMAKAIHKLFVKYGVKHVFAGHEHMFAHAVIDGVNYWITGGAGAPLYPTPEKGGFFHYLLAKFDEKTKNVDVTVILPWSLNATVKQVGNVAEINFDNRLNEQAFSKLHPSFYVDVEMPPFEKYVVKSATCDAKIVNIKDSPTQNGKILTVRITPNPGRWFQKVVEKVVVVGK